MRRKSEKVEKSKHLKGQLDPPVSNVTFFAPKEVSCPVLKICFGPPTAESKNLKNHVNFDVGDLFFRSPALWSSQNVFGPPTAGRVVVDIKDRDGDICEVEWKFSRSLLSQFQELPAQALQAKLLGVKPNTEVSESTYD